MRGRLILVAVFCAAVGLGAMVPAEAPATSTRVPYSEEELLGFYDRMDQVWDEHALQDVIGYGPQPSIGKLSVDILSPGVNTVRKLYSIFPADALSISVEDMMRLLSS